ASLGAKAVAEEQRQREAQALGESLEKAKALLAQGEPEQAAGLLRPLLAAGPNEEAERLLERAQAAIVASVAAQPGDNQGKQRNRQIEEALGEARQLQASGRLPDAFDRLETVFALDPYNGSAQELLKQLLAAQKTSQQNALIQETLRAAGAQLAGGRFEEALSAANRVLALDRKNPEALGIVGRAYAQISQRLLEAPGASGAKAAENIPPAIRFADLRQDVNGERIEVVERPEFRLNGVAIDSSPVTIAFLAEGRPVEGTST